MFSIYKIYSILILLLVIVFSVLLSFQISYYNENFESGTYTSSLLNTLGPIIFDSSSLSVDKIESLQKLTPPITDTTITSFVNSGGDADTIISNIKNYLGSCPRSSNQQIS
jgi:hypothetical protein